jgi:TPR repeat protein
MRNFLKLFLTSAYMYKEGMAGHLVDYEKARKLCLKAAEHKAFIIVPSGKVCPNLGVAEAENYLGMTYRHGMGIDKVKSELIFELKNIRNGLSVS